ncbi:hypothetical protein [Leptolyngbya sp. CCY15150]|uniref:hypothetical protein n=1 Tax=Leptolyngbya sp. CCY15150 TaxID=2767772 RepID=UPI00194F39ED|nr:hypothetical protein [Leptolyngbya sp. CCY15150]
MKRDLPDWLQPLLTIVTAKPYTGEMVRFRRTPLQHLAGAVVSTILGISISSLGMMLGAGGVSLVPIGWGLTVHGTHKLYLTLRHACAHYTVTGHRRLDDAIGNAISVLTLSLNHRAYQRRYLQVHHAARLLKPGDGTYDFLIQTAGLRPGKSLSWLWRKVILTLISPRIHLRRLLDRLSGCFFSDDWVHNLVALVWWGLVTTVVTLGQVWLPFLVVWGIPITVLFNVVTALRLFVEHRWPHPQYRNARHRRALAEMTAAIFFGEATPEFSGAEPGWVRVYRWALWWGRLLGYHLPARALVLTGDAPCHDYHHRHPSSRDWSNASVARQQDLEAGCPGWPISYLENWGLCAAIQDSLMSLSRQSSDVLNHR